MLFVCVDMIIHYFSNKSLYLYFFVSYGWKQSIYTSIEKTVCCVFLRLVYSMLPVSLDCLRLVYTMLPVSLDCLRLVYSMLPVSLDSPFLITLSVFSNVYLLFKNILFKENVNIRYDVILKRFGECCYFFLHTAKYYDFCIS